MASRAAVTLVFVIPTIASVALGGVVMAQILAEPGRGAGGASGHVSLVGLAGPYEAPASVSVRVSVAHEAFDCGDLDIVVHDAATRETVGHGGFFGQCFAQSGSMIPVGGPFTISVEDPGEYEITATLTDAQKRNRAAISGVFTVN